MKFFLIFLFLFLFLFFIVGTVSAYQIVCSDNNESGIIMWNDKDNLTIEMKEMIIDLFEDKDFINCTILEEPTQSEVCNVLMKPIINILNSNIRERNAEIKKLKINKYFNYIFLVVIIFFIIREIVIKRKIRKDLKRRGEQLSKKLRKKEK